MRAVMLVLGVTISLVLGTASGLALGGQEKKPVGGIDLSLPASDAPLPRLWPPVKSLKRGQGQVRGLPIPSSSGMGFLRDQGAWYTPLSQAGMLGYYDMWQRHASGAVEVSGGHLRATYSPLHVQPAIQAARDEDCLVCHQEVLADRVRRAAPAGVKAAFVRASYQNVSTYAGPQETFHRRHLVTDLARQVMDLRCNTCHQGHDPREEAPGGSADATGTSGSFTLRKQVNPESACLRCHGQFNWAAMGLPGPWAEVRQMFGNNCLLCHSAIRTNRHQVNYLKAEAIEAAGAQNAELCFGCHGGRAWYQTSFAYPRTPWPGMAAEVPDWAQGRPPQSEARFLKAFDPSTASPGNQEARHDIRR